MRTILYMSYRYRLQLTSTFPISVHLHCNRIQYPLLRSTLYTEYTHHPVPSIRSLLLSLVTLLSTCVYAHTAHACRSPHCSYLKFWSQRNCDSPTLQEKWLKPGPSCLQYSIQPKPILLYMLVLGPSPAVHAHDTILPVTWWVVVLMLDVDCWFVECRLLNCWAMFGHIINNHLPNLALHARTIPKAM